MTGRFVGAQLFRPPNPDPDDFDRDLGLIRDHGISLVRAWLYWSQVNPRLNAWTFAAYDRFVDAALARGLSVLIQLVPESMPEWFIADHRDALLVNAKGETIATGADGMVAVGGAQGLSPDDPEVATAVDDFIGRTVERYRGRVQAYDLCNEIMPYGGLPTNLYHPRTQTKFRQWLRAKYGGVEALNAAWGGHTFTAWDQVPLPRQGTHAIWLDALDFGRQWIAEHLRRRHALMKAADPGALCVLHTGGSVSVVTRESLDVWALAEVADVWGTSDYETDFFRTMFLHDATASAAAARPWWLSEQSGGRTYNLFGDRARSPEWIEQKMLQAFASGAQANLVWQWRPERFGQESPHFGLVEEDGAPNERSAIVARLAKGLARHRELLDTLRLPAPRVALAMDWRTRVFEWASYGQPAPFSEPEFLGWHRALTLLGVVPRILSLERLCSGCLADVGVLVLPLAIQDAPGLQQLLSAFVARGGCLLAGPYFMIYRADCFVSPQSPPAGMQRLFGSRRRALVPGVDPAMSVSVPGSRVSFPFEGFHVRESYELAGAEVIGDADGEPVATVRREGAGMAIRLGTLAGTAYGRGRAAGFGAWLRALLETRGIRCIDGGTDGVVIRAFDSDQGPIYFVFNATDSELSAALPGSPRSARDLLAETTLERSGRQLDVPLAPRQGRLILAAPRAP